MTLDKYNPFNPLKILKHITYWENILEKIPPPIFVTVDPINSCNFNCRYCNSAKVKNNDIKMNKSYMIYLANLLADWGVKAICIAGGGEPLLNNDLPSFLNRCKIRNLKTAIVTNGSMIDKFIPYLIDCTWVGISIDAATDDTLKKLKNTSDGMFQKIIDNIKKFVEYRNAQKSKVQIGYKFLIHPYNYREILDASKIAKDIGCDLIHIRPGGNPWFELDNINKDEFNFNKDIIDSANYLIKRAKYLYEDDNFKIYDMMYKFSDEWRPKITYNKCYALHTNCYFSPDKKLALCCDRRGDKNLELCEVNESATVEDLNIAWRSDRHKDITRTINVHNCPRCTYAHVNEIFENVILEDKMMCDFI